MRNASDNDYRQPIENLRFPDGTVYVGMEKYVIAHADEAGVLKTPLGSCVWLLGYRDRVGFLAHFKLPSEADKMLRQLREDVKRKTGRALEDFNLTITGGNRVLNLSGDYGKRNIDSVRRHLNRDPDSRIHLGKNEGNLVQISLKTGVVESQSLGR